MSIKGLKTNFGQKPYYPPKRNNILEKTITVKDLLLYAGYGLGVIVLLFIIVLIPFMIGRASVDCNSLCTESSLNKTAKVSAATSLINEIAEESEEEAETETVEEEVVEEEPEEEPEEEVVEEEVEEEEYDENARYLRTDPRVATSYSDIDIDLLDFDYEMRGADWGTISNVKIIITNNQQKIVIPYTLKMKIYNVGDSASDWWDDEINLRDHLNIIVPGGYKQLTLDSHVSFSETDVKKRLSIHLFDEVGKSMGSRVKEIEIEG